MLAEATVLGAEDLELGARRASVEQRRDAIRRLVPRLERRAQHRSSTRASSTSSPTRPRSPTFSCTTPTGVEHELLSVAPGRLPSTRIDGRTRVANVYSARRGIKTRALYQHTALRDRATRVLPERAGRERRARSGSRRPCPGRSLVVDREVALLPIPTDDPGRHGLAVVREPNVIAWVVATFEQLWAEASPLEDVIHQPAATTPSSTRPGPRSCG